jgi:hypothetical protein
MLFGREFSVRYIGRIVLQSRFFADLELATDKRVFGEAINRRQPRSPLLGSS